MKSRVCKKAHELIKEGHSKSLAFKAAWASELKLGKVINIEYGDFGNHVECTVTSIELKVLSPSLGKYFTVHAVTKRGVDIEFCLKPKELINL